MLKRYPNNNERLNSDFLLDNLNKCVKYDRIAGYLSNSILKLGVLDVINENINIRIICNSENLSKKDVLFYLTATTDNQKEDIKNKLDLYMKAEWDKTRKESISIINKSNPNSHFDKLYKLIKNGNIQIRVIPSEMFFLHGKAGLFVYDEQEINFLTFCGSLNETYNAYENNYEILWTDDSFESKIWFNNQFNKIWKQGIPLSELIIEDINKIYQKEFVDIEKDNIDLTDIAKKHPAIILKSSPIYQYGDANGLWVHQEDFVELLLKEHFDNNGARFLLADMVGLGKTIELGAFLKIIATQNKCKPILLFIPRPIVQQWQDELLNKFDLPSAVFEKTNNKEYWICKDKNGVDIIETSFKKCPRKIGIMSTGYITRNKDKCFLDKIQDLEYECIIVDEGHKMRRDTNDFELSNVPLNPEEEKGSTNLYKFIYSLSPKTKSCIIATATPIQLSFIELWDLLHILSNGNMQVLGNKNCFWNKNIKKQMDLMRKDIDENFIKNMENSEFLDLLINPLIMPFDKIHIQLYDMLKSFSNTTDAFNSKLANMIYNNEFYKKIKSTNDYILNNNPYTFRVIRRTREQLEKEKLIKHIEIKYNLICIKNPDNQFNDNKYNQISSNYQLSYLNMAAEKIYQFCSTLEHQKAKGLLYTLLLRRTFSSIIAGYSTIERILDRIQNNKIDYNYLNNENEKIEYDEDIIEGENEQNLEYINIEEKQIQYLQEILNLLNKIKNNDPKIEVALNIIKKENLDLSGVILFSQFYDTANVMFDELIKQYPNENIALYAGGNKSKLYIGSKSNLIKNVDKNLLQESIQNGSIKLVVGTDAASEGLNLQTLNSLINLDLPYNPTKFEQRKGRIFRIGQRSSNIYIYNLIYDKSIDNDVICALKKRFETIQKVFDEYDSDSVKIKELWTTATEKKNNNLKQNLQVKENNLNKYIIPTTIIKNKKLNWKDENKEILEEQLYEIYSKPWYLK